MNPEDSLPANSLRGVTQREDAAAAVALVRRYYDLFNERRFDEAARLISPDASFIHRPTKERLVGPAGYRSFADAWVAAVPNARVQITGITVEESTWIRVDFVGHGTHDGTMELGDIRFPPTGRQVEVSFAQRFDIREGKIVEAILEFDLLKMRRMLSE